MTFCTIVGHASRQTARIRGPSTIDRSNFDLGRAVSVMQVQMDERRLSRKELSGAGPAGRDVDAPAPAARRSVREPTTRFGHPHQTR